MDDPGWSWPAWKFGLKRDDLFTTLQDKYNTFSFNIQDPEAFHHDVYELSNNADTLEDFYRLMADRRRQRLFELNHSLEVLAVEIIANPKLMASEQWQHAVQLFRTKSFDSIVRLFASYLPDEYLDHHETRSTSSSFSEATSVHTASTTASSVEDAPYSPFLDSDFLPNGPVMTEEPCSLDADEDVHCTTAHGVEAPLSPPESEPMLAEEAVSSPTDVESQGYISTHPPSRSMSFSGSESEGFGPDLIRRSLIQDDEASQSDDCDTAITSLSDCGESRSSLDFVDEKEDDLHTLEGEAEDDDYFPTTQLPEDEFDILDTLDVLDSDTPTPRPEAIATCYVEYKSARSSRLPSPPRRSPSPRPLRAGRYDVTPLSSMRRSPEEALSKVQKISPDSIRKRPKGRI